MKPLYLCLALVASRGLFGAEPLDFGRMNVDAKDVSMVALLTSPRKFERIPIRVVGVFSRDYEGAYLFLGRDSFEAYDTASAVEMPMNANMYPATTEQLGKLEGLLVAIEGVVEIRNDVVFFKAVTRVANRGSALKRGAPR